MGSEVYVDGIRFWGFLPVISYDCDANGTYTPDEVIQGVISKCSRQLGNPSSAHRGGQRAKATVEEARDAVRRLVGAHPSDTVIFTSGATEANNTIVASCARQSGRMVSTLIEHPCILEPLKRLLAEGRDVALVAPDAGCRISPEAIFEVLTPDTAFVSVMAANNEVGVINPMLEIVRAVRQRAPHAVIHTDAAQFVGKVASDMQELGVDVMTLSAHKLGALSGTGVIIAREGISIAPLLVGGAQEGKLRGGTENVLGIAVLGAVADLIRLDLTRRISAMRIARDTFEDEIVRALPGCEVNAQSGLRLPNTTSLYIPGIRADDLIVALDLAGVLISSGAACSSGKPEPSHVLMAMGQPSSRIRSTVRVSFRADSERSEILQVVTAFKRAVTRMI